MSARSATPASSTAPTRRHWFTQPAVLAAVVGGALTALAWLSVVYYWNPQIATDELNALGDNRRVVLQSALDDIDQTVQTVAAYFNTSDDEVERNEFDSFLERLPESSAVLGRIVWAPRVPHDRRAQFEAEAAREGRRDYHIREVKPNGALVPAADAEEYFPILFSTGAVALSPAVEGIDLGSQPGLPPAMARARDADRPVASQLFPLQTDYGPFMGITLLTPVYQFGKPHLTLDERRRNLAGYVAAVFAPGMVLDRSLRSIPSPRGLDIYFFPENAGPGDPPFHVRSSLLRKTPAPRRTLGELEAGLHWNSRLMLGGARWQMVVVPIAAAPLLDAHRREWAVVGAGLAVTALVALYLLHLTRQRQRLEQEIRLRREAEDRVGFTNTILSAAMESSLDGILVVDQNGRIISYNRRLTEIWGIPPDLPPGAADEPVLQAVTSQVKDPERFEARVKFLYDHPEEQGQDRIETKDGRVFERFSRSLFYRDEEYLGRIWFFHDVTEREAMEEAMRQSEEKYRNLVESTTDYIWETGEDGRYTYVSPAAKPMLGYAPSELIGKTPFDIMPAAEAARVSTEFAGITRERRSFSMLENVVRRKDGNEIVLETSGVPVLDRDGSLKGYRGIDRDVTERRRIADALAYRGRLLHALATSATQLLTSPSFEEGIQNALGNIGEAMGVHRLIVMEGRRTPTGIDELAMQYGWHSAEAPTILDPSSFARVSRGVQGDPWFKPLAEGRPVMETLSHAQGPIRSLLESLDVKSILIVPVTIDGKYWGQIGVDECKSEREWTDTELDILNSLAQMIGTSMMRARYLKQLADANTIVQNSPTILYRVRGEPSLPMVYISHNITSFGYDPAELIESPQFYRSLVHPDDEEKVREAIATLMKKDSGPAVVDFRMRTADGRYRWVENRYTPVRDAGGRLSEIEGVLIDITERKQAEEKIALLARTDSLTGLANRATFVDRLHQSFAAARRGAAPFGLL
jgi:PAS domain S-box-containing protein